MINTTYDPEADAVYVQIAEGNVAESAEVGEDVVLDYDAEGRVLGIEFLAASKRLAPGRWTQARAPKGPRQRLDAAE
jgi:YD repeat-containing protein